MSWAKHVNWQETARILVTSWDTVFLAMEMRAGNGAWHIERSVAWGDWDRRDFVPTRRSVLDVGMPDRFELLSSAGRRGGADGSESLPGTFDMLPEASLSSLGFIRTKILASVHERDREPDQGCGVMFLIAFTSCLQMNEKIDP